jgi:F420H(2)-dependent quinone reductase
MTDIKAYRTTPLVHFRDGEPYAMTATNNGTGKAPTWLPILRDYPAAKVRVGAEETKAFVSELSDIARDRLWDRMADEHPLFSLCERRAHVAFPVVVLDSQSAESSERSARCQSSSAV